MLTVTRNPAFEFARPARGLIVHEAVPGQAPSFVTGERADSLREYLTGASYDGGHQNLPEMSLGGFRSSIEAASFRIRLYGAMQGVRVRFASGANAPGIGFLVATDENTLTWRPYGVTSAGTGVVFETGQTQLKTVEGADVSQFLRILGTPPFTVDALKVDLTPLLESVFSLRNVQDANATAGISSYRATIIRNESIADVSYFKRWIAELASQQTSNVTQLGASGAGTIRSSGSFADWPVSGWVRIENSSGTLREVAYYPTRDDHQLNVPSAGRGLLGTSAGAGASTDIVHSVPGIAIGFDSAGVQSFGSQIAPINPETNAPSGVTWNLGITKETGLSLFRLAPGEQIGIWIWRHIPSDCMFSPNVYHILNTSFFGY